jgi:uncharacterized protein
LKLLIGLSFVSLICCSSCNSQEKKTNKFADTVSVFHRQKDSLIHSLPVQTGYVNDFTGIFNNTEEEVMDSIIRSFEKESGVEIAVVTLDSVMVNDKDFDDFTLRIANLWGVGKKDINTGILIAISPQLRRIRIQNGYGIEKVLTNENTAALIDKHFIPQFSEGKFFEGTKSGLLALITSLRERLKK